MEIICLEEAAFQKLLERVAEMIRLQNDKEPDKWISGAEAMRLMRINSKTTLQKLRDEGKIRFSQPMHRVILYDRESLLKYLEENAKEPFNQSA